MTMAKRIRHKYYAAVEYGKYGIEDHCKRFGPFDTIRAAHAFVQAEIFDGLPIKSNVPGGIVGYRVEDETGLERRENLNARG
jgi:hypothetical protein